LNNKTGRIYKGVGGLYFVETASGVVQCRARGKFRLEKITPMIGDIAEVAPTEAGEGYIVEILPRKNFFLRPPVSNLDKLVIIASAAPPVTDYFLIDRMAAVAINKGIEPIIVINKCDLNHADMLYETYRLAGLKTVRASAETGEGRAELLAALEGVISAFSGNSGVGKSSLLNMIAPRTNAEVGGLNEKIGRGRHTTRHVELFRLENGAIVADTPGFSSFDSGEADKITTEELEHCFPEFESYLGECRYTGCAHIKDAGCAVLAALKAGKIAKKRHESYCKMYDVAKSIKPWENKG